MTSSIRADIEKRKAIYPDWKTQGMPLATACEQCVSRYMRVHFTKRKPSEFRVICDRCGFELTVA
jgi:hypothetical protein